MSLDYRTEIELVVPRELFDDPVCGYVLATTEVKADSRGNKIMLFTDPRTVAALRAADEKVREAFLKSGYGLKPWEDTALVTGKADFLRKELFKLGKTWMEQNLEREKVRNATMNLVMYAVDITKGKVLDKDGFPIVGDPEVARLLRAPVREAFDPVAALNSAVDQAVDDSAAAAPPVAANVAPPPPAEKKRGFFGRMFG